MGNILGVAGCRIQVSTSSSIRLYVTSLSALVLVYTSDCGVFGGITRLYIPVQIGAKNSPNPTRNFPRSVRTIAGGQALELFKKVVISIIK